MVNKCLIFILRNCWSARRLTSFGASKNMAMSIEGLKRRQILQALKVYKSLSDGNNLSICKVILLLFFPGRLCLVAVREGKVIGVELFYFNKRDVECGTVHEGYIGVIPEAQGGGIGTALRKKACRHFSKSGLLGISSRVSLNNTKSLKSAKNAGFSIQEEYYDSRLGEERCYLVFRF